MTTNEILLIIGAVLLLILPRLILKKLPNKTQLFVRLSAGILLLILVWGFGFEEANGKWMKMLLTIIVLSSIAKDVKEQFLNKKKAEA